MKIVNGCFFIFTMLKRNINYRNMLPCAGATFELARSKECMHEWGQWSWSSFNQFSTRRKLYWKCVLFYQLVGWGVWGGRLNAPYNLVFILHSPFYLINEDSMPPPRPLGLLFEHQWSGFIFDNNSNVMYFCSLGILVENMKKLCKDIIHHKCDFWMGFHFRAQEGNWVWSNGDPGYIPIIFKNI